MKTTMATEEQINSLISEFEKRIAALRGQDTSQSNPRKVKLFHNFTDKPFSWKWNGKLWTFKAGEKKYMPAYLAEHFAKHLVNRELDNRKGDVAADSSKSPSNPDAIPMFMELFNKACIDENPNDAGPTDEAQAETDILNKQMQAVGGTPSIPEFVEDPEKPKNEDDWMPSGEPHVIVPKDDGEEDSNFKEQ